MSTLGDLHSAPVLLSLFGIGAIAILFALNVRGAVLIGILASTLVGLLTGMVAFQGIVADPPSIAPTFFQLQIPNIFAEPNLIAIIFIFIFLDLFDTVGTLIGVSQQAGLMVDGKLPRARQALFSDAVATSAGALLGTSTVTSYIESASGISAGGRTGLTNIVTATLMLLALFFSPLIMMVGAGYPVGENAVLYPVIAPALIIVGSLMLKNVVHIDWDDVTESIPAFLTLLIMPLTFSITEGIAFGFISYALLKLISGQGETGALADSPLRRAFRSSVHLARWLVSGEKHASQTLFSEITMLYDLILKGGTLVDPAQQLHAVLDVAFTDGKVAAVGADLSADQARQTLDVAGNVVAPGLIDLHVHVYWGVSHFGVEPDPTCIARRCNHCG